MKLSEIKTELNKLATIAFQLPNGELVPNHFHVTEIGKVTKNFIDCGGKIRLEETVNFQLWEANDYDHRLHPEKLVHIIELSENKLQIPDLEIEVEYQTKETIGKFNLEFDGTNFLLTSKRTDCLAKENCGVPTAEGNKEKSVCCTTESNCC
jgi:hypothetical protein